LHNQSFEWLATGLSAEFALDQRNLSPLLLHP